MISELSGNRAGAHLRAGAIVAMSVCVCCSAFGGIEGRELVVTVQLPAEADPEQTLRAVEAQITNGASCGADGVTVVVREAGGATVALIGDLSAEPRNTA